jgi:hypothetical protein
LLRAAAQKTRGFSSLATSLASPLPESFFEIRMDRENDTEQSSRILVLWLDLREAMDAVKRASPVIMEVTPWNCTAERVRALWASLTSPENERALVEWLFVVTPGQDEAWAHQAILECQRRRGKGDSVVRLPEV